jgi:hypothetical protein
MAGIFYAAGPFYVRAILPLVSGQIAFLHPEYDIVAFGLNERNQIMYQVRVNRPGVDVQGRQIGGSEVKAGIEGYTLYTAPIIILSVLLAWPGLTLRKRGKAFLIALPLFLLTQLIDAPILCITRIEAAYPPETLLAKVRLFWTFVLANGGTHFMALLVALISVFATQWTVPAAPAPSGQTVARNDPCPCGSGKKYKKCCGK